MKLLCTSVIVVMLGALLPSAAHAQWGYFGGLYGPRPFGGPYFGGYPYGGYGYGGYGGYGYGGWGNPGYGYLANGYPGYGYSGWTGYGLLSAPVVTPVVSYASTATPALNAREPSVASKTIAARSRRCSHSFNAWLISRIMAMLSTFSGGRAKVIRATRSSILKLMLWNSISGRWRAYSSAGSVTTGVFRYLAKNLTYRRTRSRL